MMVVEVVCKAGRLDALLSPVSWLQSLWLSMKWYFGRSEG